MDYLKLLITFKRDGGYDTVEAPNKRTPVYVFGGSYGGMLATWLRIKYPTHFHGAVASSAPIRWFNGTVDPYIYTEIASDVLRKEGGDDCFNY